MRLWSGEAARIVRVMPWRCEACDQLVADDRPCPSCGMVKAAWTVVGDKTRTFAVAAKRVLVRRGAHDGPLPAGEAQQAAIERVDADEVRALAKARARALADAGGMPDATDVLFVELHHRQAGPAPVTVTLNLEREEPVERTFECPAPEDGRAELRLVCVHGPGGVEGIDFPGLHVLDVADSTSEEHAPTIEVAALKKPPRQVQVVASHSIELVVRDEDGRPVPGARLVLLEPDGARTPGVTNEDGVVRWDDLEVGPHHVAFEDEAFVADVEPAGVDADGDGVADDALEAEPELSGKLDEPARRGTHFVELVVQDERGQPLAGARLVLKRPDGTTEARAADEQGLVRWDGLGEGPHLVAFEDTAWVVDVEPAREPAEPLAAREEAADDADAPFTDELEGHESAARREPRDWADAHDLRALLGEG